MALNFFTPDLFAGNWDITKFVTPNLLNLCLALFGSRGTDLEHLEHLGTLSLCPVSDFFVFSRIIFVYFVKLSTPF